MDLDLDQWDLFALLGIVMIGLGLGLLAPWLGVSATGALLLAAGVIGGIRTERADQAAAAKRKEG
jgi:hypothetical protein